MEAAIVSTQQIRKKGVMTGGTQSIYCDKNPRIDLSVALIHYPVLNKYGQTIASAITNLDLHDIARTARTYGVQKFYVVTPLQDQRILAQKIVDHWIKGFGGQYNPHRREAFELIRVVESLESAMEDIRLIRKKEARVIVTSAKQSNGSIGYDKLRLLISEGSPYLLLFGTAWGLSGEVISRADYFLKPISGTKEYNHLSVRSASAVILDRLLARNE